MWRLGGWLLKLSWIEFHAVIVIQWLGAKLSQSDKTFHILVIRTEKHMSVFLPEMGEWQNLPPRTLVKMKNCKMYTMLSLANSIIQFSSVLFSRSVVSGSLRPMDCSMLGLPVHHQPPEFTQTHVHWVSDAIQPTHPLSSPSPPTFNLS